MKDDWIVTVEHAEKTLFEMVGKIASLAQMLRTERERYEKLKRDISKETNKEQKRRKTD
jgi:hypothetical protein